MDRAHRIGQKNVVNVYRLVSRGTLEEKIMGWVLSAKYCYNDLTSHAYVSLELVNLRV